MASAMDDIARYLKQKVDAFEEEAVEIFSRYESATQPRVMTLDQTRKLLGGLSLQQDELFQQAIVCVERGVYRAAHVMAWAAFMDFLEHKLASDNLVKVKTARPTWAK